MQLIKIASRKLQNTTKAISIPKEILDDWLHTNQNIVDLHFYKTIDGTVVLSPNGDLQYDNCIPT